MSLFGNLTNSGLEESQDRLGGFRIYESDAYTGTIKAMYAGASANSKARSVTVILDLDNSAGEYRETFWVSNKEDENFYVDTKDGNKKKPLAGFTHIDDICLMTTDKPLSQQTSWAEKVMNIYDADAKKEIPKSVQMLVEALGKKITFGILKQKVAKQKKDSNGIYQDTGETREENVTDKIFHVPSNLTVVEARNKIQQPKFYGQWVEQNRGKVRDRTAGTAAAAGVQNGRPGINRPAGGPPQSNGAAPKTNSLFG